MKVLMLAEYFIPYDLGGSEWSTFYLAKGLSKKGVEVAVLTPNYGNAKNKESTSGFEIIRFPFYKKMKVKRQLSPFWQTNTIWIVWTSFFTLAYCLKKNIDIIHVQGKYFLPAAIIAKILLGKKVIITIRDYVLICPLGTCLLKDDRGCNLINYFWQDLGQYIAIYLINKGFWPITFQVFAAIRSRIVSFFLKFLLNFVDVKIAISDLTRNIFASSGIKDIRVIFNPIEVKKPKQMQMIQGKYTIIFAGRLTPGKGPDLLIEAIPKVLKRYPDTLFIIYGEGFLKAQLVARVRELGALSNVEFAGQVEHQKVLDKIAQSQVTVVPSIWPEPLSRTALESLSVQTPIVLTTRTGNIEFFKDGLWGSIAKPHPDKIAQSLVTVLKHTKDLRNNIKNDLPLITQELSKKVYEKYLKVYWEVTS